MWFRGWMVYSMCGFTVTLRQSAQPGTQPVTMQLGGCP
jgi:hypothetical protein